MAIVIPPYHFGLVVEHLERAQADLTAALGVSWARDQRRTACLEAPGAPLVLAMAYAYTIEGPPYLEVIEQRAGSPFEQLGLHHIGLWSDDPAGESARLSAAGWPRETVGLAPDGSWAGALYHRGVGGLRVEVVDIGVSGPKLARYLGGGDYTGLPQ
jgi:hypothetical protein